MLPDMSKSQVVQEHGLLTLNRKVVKAVIHRVATEVPGVVQLGGDSIWKRILRWLGVNVCADSCPATCRLPSTRFMLGISVPF